MKFEKISGVNERTISEIEFLNRTTEKSETNYMFSCIVENRYYLLLLVAVSDKYNKTKIKCYIAEDENRKTFNWKAINIKNGDVDYLLSLTT